MGLETLVYLDSCVAIYLVEEIEPYATLVRQLIEQTSQPSFVISSLTKMECLVMPLRTDDDVIKQKFLDWFDQVESLNIPDADFIAAAELRAKNPSLKTPDALHLAASARRGCDEFWTNDNRLSKVAPLKIININVSNA